MARLRHAVSVFVLSLLFLAPSLLFAQGDNSKNQRVLASAEKRNLVIERSLDYCEKQKQVNGSQKEVNSSIDRYSRQHKSKDIINKEKSRSKIIELAVAYAFAVQGQQTFEVVLDGYKISELKYPQRGQMVTYNGEIHLTPRFSIGGKYGNSIFKNTTCTDSDWFLGYIGPDLVYIPDVWLQSNLENKAKVEIYDLNFYYRLVNLSRGREEQFYGFDSDLSKYSLPEDLDSLSFDIFFGYQRQKGRYGMSEGVWRLIYWTPVDIPIDGVDSFYKVDYQGPRLGVRAEGSLGKLITTFSFAYAWLKTKGYGWWNLREYEFEQVGSNGYGLDFAIDLSYKLTPHLSAGIGFTYATLNQRKLKESGIQRIPSYYSFEDLDIIRNLDNVIYAPFVVLKGTW